MKKLEIDIPEELNTKDWVFNYCFTKLKEIISSDDTLENNLSPLWWIELISGFEVLNKINETHGKSLDLEDIEFYIRQYNQWEGNKKIKPIRKYGKVSNGKVYLLSDLEDFLGDFIREQLI